MKTIQTNSELSALERVIAILGSQTALAKKIGVTQQAVSIWVKASKPIPAEHVITLEKATGVSRYDMRPDIFGLAGRKK